MVEHDWFAADKRHYKDQDARLFRIVCACGWAGVWAYNKGRAEADFQGHVADPEAGAGMDLSYRVPVEETS